MMAYLFLALAVVFRCNLVPHGQNFTPLAAALLFFGAKMPRKQAWIPVALFAVVDLIMNRHYGYPFTADLLVTWALYAVMVAIGMLMANRVSAVRVVASSVAASISFFVISNFMVWAIWTMYPKTGAGLLECYAAAVPFFRNSVVSDLIFAAVFFGSAAYVEATQRKAIKAAA